MADTAGAKIVRRLVGGMKLRRRERGVDQRRAWPPTCSAEDAEVSRRAKRGASLLRISSRASRAHDASAISALRHRGQVQGRSPPRSLRFNVAPTTKRRGIAAPALVICLDNTGYEVSLERLKIYVTLSDARVARHGLLRVLDESGADYLFPGELFIAAELPAAARKAVLAAAWKRLNLNQGDKR